MSPKRTTNFVHVIPQSVLNFSCAILRIPILVDVKDLPDVFMLGFLISKEYAFIHVCERLGNF